MRVFDSDIIDELEAREFHPAMLLKFSKGQTDYCYTDLDVPLVIESNISGFSTFKDRDEMGWANREQAKWMSGTLAGIYQPRGFKVDSIQYSQNRIVDNIRLEIDNLDSVMTGIFLTGDIQGEDLLLGIALLSKNAAFLTPNMITNPGMETGNPPTGWTNIWTPETFERSGVQKHDDTYSAHIIDSTPSYGGFYRYDQPLISGKLYKLSFWYYIVSGSIQGWLTHGNGVGYAIQTGELTTTGSWVHFEGTGIVTATGAVGALVFRNYSNSVPAEFYIDDVCLMPDSSVIGTATLFIGGVDAWELDEERLKLTAVSVMNAWSQETLNLHSPSCRWKEFKNVATCKYAGVETWCDRTYTRCSILGNTGNYGGFRWLPSIVDKAIWWGKIPKIGEE